MKLFLVDNFIPTEGLWLIKIINRSEALEIINQFKNRIFVSSINPQIIKFFDIKSVRTLSEISEKDLQDNIQLWVKFNHINNYLVDTVKKGYIIYKAIQVKKR